MASRSRAPLRAPVVAAKPTAAPDKPYQPPSRAGKRGVTFYLEPETWKQLRMLSVTNDQPIGVLMEQAVQLLLNNEKRGRRAA